MKELIWRPWFRCNWQNFISRNPWSNCRNADRGESAQKKHWPCAKRLSPQIWSLSPRSDRNCPITFQENPKIRSGNGLNFMSCFDHTCRKTGKFDRRCYFQTSQFSLIPWESLFGMIKIYSLKEKRKIISPTSSCRERFADVHIEFQKPKTRNQSRITSHRAVGKRKVLTGILEKYIIRPTAFTRPNLFGGVDIHQAWMPIQIRFWFDGQTIIAAIWVSDACSFDSRKLRL